MQCPRCRADIDVLPDPGGSIVCPGCGARLMTRPTARVGEDTLRTTRPPPPPPGLDTPVAGTPAITWPPAEEPPPRAETPLELELAQVPVRTVVDGNAGIQAIAAEKPDVIAIELGIGGSMAAKDVINMIKATMEWVDIPIILYTRLPVESQKEARTLHGADDLVLKRSGPPTLVSHVIAAFRRTP